MRMLGYFYTASELAEVTSLLESHGIAVGAGSTSNVSAQLEQTCFTFGCRP